MQMLTIQQAPGRWTPDQLYTYFKATVMGFQGLSTMEERDPHTGALRGELRLSFSEDTPILPTEQAILDILASAPPPAPPAPPTLEDRIAKLETDVAELKAKAI